jgi:hypothetical protein
LLALLPGWLLQQKGVSWVLVRVLRPASERASGVVTKTSTNNNSNKGGGHKYKQGTEKKKKEKKGASVPRPSLPIFLHLFIGPSPPRPPPAPLPQNKTFLVPKTMSLFQLLGSYVFINLGFPQLYPLGGSPSQCLVARYFILTYFR